ncbi:MAG TPA: heme o synthase [Candidatus Lustribacter sp.]
MSSTLSRTDGAARPVSTVGWRAVLSDYLSLTKPRIIVLLLITTLASMIMAARGIPPLAVTVWALIGGALSAASAGTFNCVYDADIDGKMKRTMSRPLPRGTIAPNRALAFAILLGVVSFTMLYFLVNPLAAWLSLGGNAYYVFVYTMWLKRRTSQNIVIGGAAGSIPPLVGWAAVTGTIGMPALALAVLIFLWTPPHFWALALMTETDYGKAGIPMLPNVHGVKRTKREMLAYTIVLFVFCVALVPLHVMGPIFLAAAVVVGGWFLYDSINVLRNDSQLFARGMFKFSLVYLALMCLAAVIDRVVFA